MAETAKAEREDIKEQSAVREQTSLSDFTKGLTVEQERQVLAAMQGTGQLGHMGLAI